MKHYSLHLLYLLTAAFSLIASCSTKSTDATGVKNKKAQEPVIRYAKKEDPPITAKASDGKAAKPVPITPDDLVNINLATEFELETLPGIGPADAETIIENRPYRSREELLMNQVISEDVYAGIKARIATK